jgi:hypothetical protein
MNKLAWLFATTTLLLAGLCLDFWMQLRHDSAQARAEVQLDAELRKQLEGIRVERDRLESDVKGLRAAQARAAPLTEPTARTNAALAPPGARALELSAEHRRTMLRQRNGQLFRQLGLSDAQIEALLDVLAKQEERARAAKPGAFLGAMGPSSDPNELARNRAEIEAVVGSDKAAKLETWQKLFTARHELRRVRDQLEDVGEPLSEEQQNRLNELVQLRPRSFAPERKEGDTPEAFMERFRSWRQDSRQQLRTEVSSVLNPRQLARYDEMDELAHAFDRTMISMPPLQGAALAAGHGAPLPVR